MISTKKIERPRTCSRRERPETEHSLQLRVSPYFSQLVVQTRGSIEVSTSTRVMLCYVMHICQVMHIYIFFFSFFLKIKLDIVKLENVFMIVQMKWPAISPLALLFLSVVDF